MLETFGKFVRCMERCGKSHGENKMLFALREQSPVPSVAPERCPQAEARPVLPRAPLRLCRGRGCWGSTRQTRLAARAAGHSDLILSEGFPAP